MMFEMEKLALRRDGRAILSLTARAVEQGRHLLLLGPSGCGKTSVLNLMAGLLRPDSGRIAFQGQAYEALSAAALDDLRARNFGFIFQKLHLIGHLSVAQNIALAQGRGRDVGRVQTLIDDLGLAGKEKQKARDLSTGEAQRVAIARAVVHSPQVIFADEPTSALDDANTDRVMDLLFAQADKTGATVIAATHDTRIKARFSDVWEMAA